MIEWNAARAARLRIATREGAGLTQDDLIEITGIPRSSLQRILGGKVDEVSEERLKALVTAAGEEMGYILDGRRAGESEFVAIPVNDIQASAGPGRFALDEDKAIGAWPFPRDWLIERFGRTDALRVIGVKGDSQEPELRDGDSVLIDLSQSGLRDGMCVVLLDEALMIKRVQIEGGRVKLKSANQSYDDIIVDLAADQERFRVVAKAICAVKLL